MIVEKNGGLPLEPGSLIYAPMEGITDETYRSVILDNYPDWDYVSTDFLRIPSVGHYPDKHIIKHYGRDTYNTSRQDKTILQILTAGNALTKSHVLRMKELGFKWLDINLGCPSRKVCNSKGGSFLLSELGVLEKIISEIREHFPHTFTAKIRVGYEDDQLFPEILKLLERCGVDAITIHARTRAELYKGVANWDYVKRAVELVDVPIIGNGDIWTAEDISKYFEYTKCHSVMLARSAMKSPFLAHYYKNNIPLTLKKRSVEIEKFFTLLYQAVDKLNLDSKSKGRRLKAASRFAFDDFPQAASYKKRFLLSEGPEEMLGVLKELKEKTLQGHFPTNGGGVGIEPTFGSNRA